jgi:hypothetical protein
MRNLLLAGAAGLFIVGTASAAFADTANPNVPNWSPYAIMGFPGDERVVANPGYGGNPGFPAGAWHGNEGRAAYIEPTYQNHWRYPAEGSDRPTGYDNTRQDSAYPPGEPGFSY